MHGIERSLEQHYQGKPFVILCVSCDPAPESMKAGLNRDHITWPSIHDLNSINMDRWNINRTPTLVLIDSRGMIRYRSVSIPTRQELEKQIDLLLEEQPVEEKH